MAANAIATAIAEGFKFLGKYISGSETRRLKKAIDLAEDYISTNTNDKIKASRKQKSLNDIARKFYDVLSYE